MIGFCNTQNDTLFHSVHAGSGIKKATAYDLSFTESKVQELDSIQRVLGKKNKTKLIDWSISLLRNYQTFYDGAKVLGGGFKNGLGYKKAPKFSRL